MSKMHTLSFFDELEKIGKAKKGPEFRTSIAAHEMGHARDLETSRIPRLRTVARSLGPLAGVLAGSYAASKRRPGLAAGAAALGLSPMLADEAIASYTAVKELKKTKKFSPEEMKKMRGQLLRAGGTYLSSAAGTVGAMAALGAGRGDLAYASMAAGGLGALGVSTSMASGLEGSPKTSKKGLEKLRKQMGIQAKVYERKGGNAASGGGRWSEFGAFYLPKARSKFTKMMYENELGNMVGGSPKKLQKMISEGAVVLPRAKV
jgi:hypothetical protein